MKRHLRILEQEAIELIREVITTNNLRDVWSLYSIGKDSCVMRHLMTKAFYPRPVNIRFLHIDTGFEFPEMYELRDRFAKDNDLVIYTAPTKCDPLAGNDCTDVMRAQALLEALAMYDVKVVFDARQRDEEKSRDIENMVSVRIENYKASFTLRNPEINKLWNTSFSRDSALHIFPLSNWTELDILEYILAEKIEVTQ